MKRILFGILCFVCSASSVLGLEINSKNAALYNLTDDTYLYEKNSEIKTPIASITKLMTVLVGINYIDDLDKKVTINENDFENLIEQNASLAGFEIGQTVTYRDLLYGLMLPSGADAVLSLVHNTYLTEKNYIEKMNELSSKIGLTNTSFNSTTGLDTDNNYSTIKDLVKLLKYALKNETFYTIFTANSYKTSDGNLTFESSLSKIIKKYNLNLNYIKGSKTGTTDLAGLCLISLAHYNNTEFILVTTQAPKDYNTPYNFLDANTIYNYYFNNYDYINITKNKILNIKTKDSLEKDIDITLPNTNYYMNKNTDLNNFVYNYHIDNVSYKNKVGEKIGYVDIYYNNEFIKNVDIVLTQKIHYNYYKIFCILFLILFLKILICMI